MDFICFWECKRQARSFEYRVCVLSPVSLLLLIFIGNLKTLYGHYALYAPPQITNEITNEITLVTISAANFQWLEAAMLT